uniref:Uncharacterized protein n=1 Tax=Octopus bimaculoides TaxID=37653 RepID=A0A0L8FVU9_OCTBM
MYVCMHACMYVCMYVCIEINVTSSKQAWSLLRQTVYISYNKVLLAMFGLIKRYCYKIYVFGKQCEIRCKQFEETACLILLTLFVSFEILCQARTVVVCFES